MVELTVEQKHEIAMAMLSEGNLENYQAICKLAENGMSINEAIETIGKTCN